MVLQLTKAAGRALRSLWPSQLNTGTLGGPMERAVLDKLVAADIALHWECPPDFDYSAEVARVEVVRPTLEAIVGHPLTLDRNVQDAAFFTELAYQSEPRSSPIGRVTLTFVAIRFSCFGRLVTVWGNVPEAPVTDAVMTKLAATLSLHDYHYVPSPDLGDPYTGSHVHATAIKTWWLRFFDYC